MALTLTRSERLPTERGPHDVGPGTYDVRAPLGAAPGTGAPFLSMADRNSVKKGGAPGPGAYDVPVGLPTDKEILAGSADFRSSAPRLGDFGGLGTAVDAPGPGTYEIGASSSSSKRPKQPEPQRTGGLVLSSKTAPSVPDQLLQRDEIVREKLQEELERDQFHPDKSKTKPKRGSDFHSSKVLRPTPGGGGSIETPGPGQYNQIPAIKEEPVDHESFQFKSKTLLPYQRNQKTTTATGPGPGEYHEATINPKPKWVIDRFDFGSKVARLQDKKAEAVPGPGAYRVEASAGPKKKSKFVGVHNPAVIMALQEMEGVPLSAFCSSDVRSCHKDRAVELAPPPGTYYENINKLYGSITAKVEQKASVGKLGVFGSRAERFPPQKPEQGGFGSLLEMESMSSSPPKDSLYGGESSMFKSTSLRFDGDDEFRQRKPVRPTRKPPATSTQQPAHAGGTEADNNRPASRLAVEQTQNAHPGAPPTGPQQNQTRRNKRFQGPGPGAYDPKIKTDYRNPYRLPRTDHLSFGSSSSRATGGEYDEKPGPGEYTPHVFGEIADATRPRLGHVPAQSQSLRPNKKAMAPGPGAYEVSKGLLKKSYNTTLNKRFN